MARRSPIAGSVQAAATAPSQRPEKALPGDGGILALVLHHGEDAVLCAVELALSDGAPTKTHVLNMLHRLIDGKSTATAMIAAPQALALDREPRANVERYDALREKLQEARHAS